MKKNIVQQSKNLIYVALIVAVAFIWIVSFAMLTDNGDADKQKQLVNAANEYVKDEIYIKAVKRLKEALTYDTPNNRSIEDRLLEIYDLAGYDEDYYELAINRINLGYASSQEYQNVIDRFLKRAEYTSAISYLKVAMKAYPDETDFSDQYEFLRYEIVRILTNYEEFQLPVNDWYIPVSDGTKWGFLGTNGRLVIPLEYEKVVPFNEGYSIVKKEDQYEIIDVKQNRWSLDKEGVEVLGPYLQGVVVCRVGDGVFLCSSSFKKMVNVAFEDAIISSNGLIFVKRNGKWALVRVAEKNGEWALFDASLKKDPEYVFTDVVRNSRGQAFGGGCAVVKDDRGYFFIDAEGNALSDKRFLEAKGSEGGWIAVKESDEKWAFANKRGEIKFTTDYSDVFSFSCDVAAVFDGDRWGYINKKGDMVIDNIYTQAYPFSNGYSLAVDGLGSCQILQLKYYELFE